MRFEVYCDESRPDILSSTHPSARYMVIGSIWLKTEDRLDFKHAIHRLRQKYRVGGEFKWQKVSPSRVQFYAELVEWFFSVQDRLRFRCIAVEHEKVNLIRFHENDQELGFYKFYYQMLHQWILDFNEYSVFCDFKRNRSRDRLAVLKRCLNYANLSSEIVNVQAIQSGESVLVQLADLLTGAAGARLNHAVRETGAKGAVVARIEQLLGRRIQHTRRDEQKFNVFVIDLQGGW